jgi:branched-subunit amino acid aminotransferase/4-amino-4-deoxychorismate lyase
MEQLETARMEIDGNVPADAQLRALALGGYGHFTAMQVRGRRVRGLDLHLSRLAAANAELFGAALDGGLVTARIRHALGPGTADASVRVYVQQPEPGQPPWMTVTVRPPGDMPAQMSLQSVPYQRAVAHLKHLGDFGQHYYRTLAARNGYDEALLTGPDGLVSEGSVCNLGCFDGTSVVWPAAAMLAGTTMQVLEREFSRIGLPVARRPVRVTDLPGYDCVFLANARGVATAASIDGVPLPAGGEFPGRLAAIFSAAPWDEL